MLTGVAVTITMVQTILLKITGYDDIADFCYSRLYKGNNVFLYGFLSKDKVEIKRIKLL